MNGTSKTLLAFVGGALAGAAVGLLLAPDKGANTRKKIMDMSDDLAEKADGKYQDFLTWKNKLRDKLSDEAEDLRDTAKETVNRMRRTADDHIDNAKRTATTKSENGRSQVPPRNAEI